MWLYQHFQYVFSSAIFVQVPLWNDSPEHEQHVHFYSLCASFFPFVFVNSKTKTIICIRCDAAIEQTDRDFIRPQQTNRWFYNWNLTQRDARGSSPHARLVLGTVGTEYNGVKTNGWTILIRQDGIYVNIDLNNLTGIFVTPFECAMPNADAACWCSVVASLRELKENYDDEK